MDLNFNKNEDHNKLLLSDLKQRFAKVKLGGGEKRIEKLHAEGKMTARERIAYLLDEGSKSIEIGGFVGDGMYAEHGGCPSGGVVIKIGYIRGKQCIVVANDATVKAGAWFPITGKKNLRAQEIAMENRLPIIYLVESAGVYLPLQDEIFPDKEHFGRIFRNNAQMSSMGITQIAAVMGSCVAGGAYLPALSDVILMVENTSFMGLGGPNLVKGATGQTVDGEELGGAWTHNAISGVAHYRLPDDRSCIARIRQLVQELPYDERPIRVPQNFELPSTNAKKLTELLPDDHRQPYEVR